MTHEPTPDCSDVHCYSCHEDEGGPAYIICGECGHLYRTAGELRRAYRRQFYRMARKPPEFSFTPQAQDVDPGPIPLRRVLWELATIRAKHIYSCQHCTHDF